MDKLFLNEFEMCFRLYFKMIFDFFFRNDLVVLFDDFLDLDWLSYLVTSS